LYLVIPDRNHTWERERQPVEIEHLVDDYRRRTSQSDGIHIDEFVDSLAWNEFSPDDPSEGAREHYRHVLRHAVNNGQDINIHFHAFEPEMFPAVIDAANSLLSGDKRLVLLDFEARFPENCPNGFLAVLGVQKPASIR